METPQPLWSTCASACSFPFLCVSLKQKSVSCCGVCFGVFWGGEQKKPKHGFIFSFCKLLSSASLDCCDVAKIYAVMLNYVFIPPFTKFRPLSFVYNYHGYLSRILGFIRACLFLGLNNFLWAFLLGKENALISAQFRPWFKKIFEWCFTHCCSL